MRHVSTFWLIAGLAATAILDVTNSSFALASALASAQAGGTEPAAASTATYWAVVKGDNVMLRSAPSVQSAYAFGRLFTGQPVKVTQSEFGWARVQAVGPSFSNIYGFVKAGSTIQYDAATKKIAVVGKTSLTAPNMDANFSPDKSWRELVPLNTGDSLQVIEEVKGQSDTYYSVRLPDRAFGWVNLQFIEAVSQQQADQYENALKNGTAFPTESAAPTPPSAPAATPETAPAPPSAAPTPPARTPPATSPPAAVAPPATTPPAEPTPAEPTAITNNPPEDNAKPTAESDAEDAARAAAREAADRAAMETRVRQTTYNDLEAIWSRVKNEPTDSAELDTLRERYLDVANDGNTTVGTRELARSRAEQIGMRIEVQKSLREIIEMRAKMSERRDSVANLELAHWQRKSYDAVGRLSASTVYNGDRLPLLYKLADPTTGFTIAYVLPGPSTKPSEALGLVVGIKGTKQYDETLRVNVIAPRAIVVLDTSTTTVVPQP